MGNNLFINYYYQYSIIVSKDELKLVLLPCGIINLAAKNGNMAQMNRALLKIP